MANLTKEYIERGGIHITNSGRILVDTELYTEEEKNEILGNKDWKTVTIRREDVFKLER